MNFSHGKNTPYVSNKLKQSFFKKIFSYRINFPITFNPITIFHMGILLIYLITTVVPVFAIPVSPKSEHAGQLADFRTKLQQLRKEIRGTRNQIDRKWFDFDAVIKDVGTDPEDLFKWVKNNTGSLPYQGILKGAWGVLQERQGNTLDRSLLLAKLLEHAGHKVEIANASLSDEGLAIAKNLMLENINRQPGKIIEDDLAESAEKTIKEAQLIAKQMRAGKEAALEHLRSQERTVRKEIAQLEAETNKPTKELMARRGVLAQLSRQIELAENQEPTNFFLSDEEVAEVKKLDYGNINRQRAKHQRQIDDERLERLAKLAGTSKESALEEIRRERMIARKEIIQLEHEADKQTKALMNKLPLKSHSATPRFTEALNGLRDHWWVLVKTGSGKEVFDLFFDQQRTPIKEAGYIRNEQTLFSRKSLPEHLYHTVTFRIVADQRTAKGKDVSHTALTHTVRTAQTRLQPIQLAYAALGNRIQGKDMLNFSTKEIRENLAKQIEWLPILRIGNDIVKQASILADGSLNTSPNLSGDPINVLGQKTNKTTQKLGGLLGGLPSGIGGSKGKSSTNKTDQLVEVRLEIDLVGAGVKNRETRTLFDFRDHVADLDKSKKMKISRSENFLTQQQFLVLPFNISQQYVAEKLRVAPLQYLELLIKLVDKKIPFKEQSVLEEISKLDLLLTELLSLALLRQPSTRTQPLAIVQTNLVSLYHTMSFQQPKVNVTHGIDVIVNNVLPLMNDAERGRQTSIRQGVFDTLLENYLIAGDQPTTNTASQFRSDLKRNHAADWVAVNLNRAPQGTMRFSNVDESTADFIVYSPTRIADDLSMGSYWLVDLDTGETLGYTSDGRGSSLVQKIIIIGNDLWLLFNIGSALSCPYLADNNTCDVVKCLITGKLTLMGTGLRFLPNIPNWGPKNGLISKAVGVVTSKVIRQNCLSGGDWINPLK